MWNWISKLGELQAADEPFVIVTVTHARGSTPRESGAKMLVASDGRIFGTIGGGLLEREAIKDSLECIARGETRVMSYPLCSAVGQCCGGNVELLLEVMNQEPCVYVFGAGHVGQALSRTLVDTPFKIFLIDERKEWIGSEAIPRDVNRVDGGWKSFVSEAKWDAKKTHVVIMTHLHDLDLEILRAVIEKPTAYLGLIGSETKWGTFSKKLLSSGVPQTLIDRVRCPVGLDIGGKSPQEIAISVAGGLIAFRNGREK